MKVAVALAAWTSVATAAPRWVDTPAWPVGKTIELSWIVHPVRDASTPELSKAPVELLATIGGTTRTIALEPQLGGLSPLNLPLCKRAASAYPLERDEAAKLTFYEGGAGGYFVRRRGDVLTVVAWEQSDGACEDKRHRMVACPRREKAVVRLHVPTRVKVIESLFEVDGNGERHAFDCRD